MQVTSKPLDEAILEAHITLDAGELLSAVEQTRKALAQGLTVKGFRKGKAPQNRVEQELDPAVVRAEALQQVVEDSFSRAVLQQQWDIMRTDNLKVTRNDAAGLEYVVRVSLWPPVTLPDLAAIKVERKPVIVSDTEMSEALDTVRNMRATFLDKTEAAITDDRVEVDFDSSISGTPVEGGSSRNHPLVIGGKTFMPGFEEELIGMTVGDTKTFSLTAPIDYYEPKLAGKVVDFTVTLRRVQSVLKPSLDDAFAKSLGTITNLDHLKQTVRQGLEREKQEKEDQRLRLAILDAILATTTIVTPKHMVEEELDSMVTRFSHDLKHRGMELPLYLARLNKTEAQLRTDWKEQAQRQVGISLVLRQITKEKAIAVSDEEIDAAVADAMGELVRSGQGTAEQIDAPRLRQALTDRLLTSKTLEFLEGVCVA